MNGSSVHLYVAIGCGSIPKPTTSLQSSLIKFDIDMWSHADGPIVRTQIAEEPNPSFKMRPKSQNHENVINIVDVSKFPHMFLLLSYATKCPVK